MKRWPGMTKDRDLEHPVITNLCETGEPDGRAQIIPVCPFCGKECETLYADKDGVTFACDNCVRTIDVIQEYIEN